MQTHDKEKPIEKESQKDLAKQVPITPKWPPGLQFSKTETLAVSVAKDLAVVLTHYAFEQLFGWAYATGREISCLGSVKCDGNTFVITEFYLLKQSGSATSTELDETAIAELIEKLLAEGKPGQAHAIKCWAHSHPGMGVFWSGTDSDTCRLLVSDYLVSLVVSDRFAIRCRIDITAPVPMSIDHVPVLYEMQQDKELTETYARQVKEAVSERFFFFEEFDDLKDKKTGQEADAAGKRPKDDYEYVPALYCGCCGSFHGDGECPLMDESRLAHMIDDDEFFI